MTALSRPISIVTPALMLALGLAACDRSAPAPAPQPSTAPDTGAAPSQTSAADAPRPDAPIPSATRPAPVTPQTPRPPAPTPPPPPPPIAAEPRWDVSRTRDGATATLVDARGPLLRLICTSGPARLRVDVPTFRPAARQDRLDLALGANRIALTARRGAGGVTAVGALPPNIAARILRARTIEARYGRQVAGPFIPPRGADAMALANACEEAVSPAPPRPAPPLPGEDGSEQIPLAFRGEWNRRVQDCGTGRNDSRLIVDARTVRFYESRGEVSSVTRNGPRAITVVARYRGEGEARSRTSRMSLSGDDSRLTIDGISRQRCPVTTGGDGRGGR